MEQDHEVEDEVERGVGRKMPMYVGEIMPGIKISVSYEFEFEGEITRPGYVSMIYVCEDAVSFSCEVESENGVTHGEVANGIMPWSVGPLVGALHRYRVHALPEEHGLVLFRDQGHEHQVEHVLELGHDRNCPLPPVLLLLLVLDATLLCRLVRVRVVKYEHVLHLVRASKSDRGLSQTGTCACRGLDQDHTVTTIQTMLIFTNKNAMTCATKFSIVAENGCKIMAETGETIRAALLRQLITLRGRVITNKSGTEGD